MDEKPRGAKGGRRAKFLRGGVSKARRRRLDSRPRRWYYDCEGAVAAKLRENSQWSTSLSGGYRDGLILPTKEM